MSPAQSTILRPPDATLEGYAWLPRMLDKARTELAGLQTDFPFGCPVDHTCMARLHIDPDTIRGLVVRHGDDDHAILDELRQRGIPPADQATFDAVALEDTLSDGGPYLRVRDTNALAEDPITHGRVFAGQDHGASVSLMIINAPPGYRQTPHTHPTEEVIAIHAGQPTLHLGETQARTVTAGQIVRIPAHTAHWLENTSPNPTHAIATHGTASILTHIA